MDVRLLCTALALAAAMVLSGVLGWRRWLGVVLLALLSFVWLTVDAAWEGPHLIDFGARHALTLADLVAVAGFAAAVWLAVRLSRVDGRWVRPSVRRMRPSVRWVRPSVRWVRPSERLSGTDRPGQP